MDVLNSVIQQEESITGVRYESLGALFSVFLNVFLGVGISLSVLAMLLAGIKLVTSMGNPREVETGRNYLKYAFIAFLLSAGSLIIKFLVFNLVGVTNQDLINGIPNF